MNAISKAKLKFISFWNNPEVNEVKNATEIKSEKKNAINLISIPKEEVEKNRSSKYQYAL